jgi:hypothetical protein
MNLSHQKDLLTGQDRCDDAERSGATQGVATPMRAAPNPHPSFPRHRADPRSRAAVPDEKGLLWQ